MKQSKNQQGTKTPGDIGGRQTTASSAQAAELFAVALRHHQSGLLAEAEALYYQILALQPNHIDSLNLLAVIAGKFGRHDMAIALLTKAIALNRRAPELQNNIAGAFWALGRLAEAKTHYERALALAPTYAEALVGLGNVLQGMGKLALAAGRYERALVLKPDFAVAHSNLAATLKNLGKPAEAAERYARALTLDANLLEAHSGLGGVLMQLGRADEARASCERALAIAPDHAESHNNLGTVLLHEGKAEEALAHCERATTLKPDQADAHNNLGIALDALGRPDDALICYQRALSINPDYAEAYNNLANLHQSQGRPEEAVANYQRALALKPDFAEAHSNLGVSLMDMGRLDDALASYGRAVAIKPDYADAHSNRLFTLTYSDSVSLDTIATEHARYGAQLEAKVAEEARVPHANPRDPNRRLRIGYVSPDFRNHSVAVFWEPLLTAHDRKAFETFCYAEVAAPDAVTARLRGLADGWVSTVGLSDAALAEKIRADGIDVLMDLAGHSAHNRIPVFARRPAPVQISWLGYSTTTGLTTIDYRLSDPWLSPPDTAEGFTERLWRLPRCSFVFSPHADAPPVGPLPADRNGYITFASFNNATKLTPLTIALWCRALRAIPDSRLLLKSRQTSAPEIVQALERQFEDNGVSPERLVWRPYAIDTAGHLAQFNDADISLDSFPFNGGTTTCESLWMGVPVLTLAGDRLVSRFGTAFLAAVGLEDLAAPTPDRFVETACALTADMPRMRDLRRTLRMRMAASALCDPDGFARAIEAAYREMWKIWCDQR